MITGIEPIAIHWAVVHGHALAVKWGLVHNSPAFTAMQAGAHVANVVPGAVSPAYVPVLNHGATAAVLSQATVPSVLSQGTAGAAGAAAAPTASASAVHDAVKLVVPVVAWAAWQLLRKSEPSGDGKGVLSTR
jgi:hypothetical protein